MSDSWLSTWWAEILRVRALSHLDESGWVDSGCDSANWDALSPLYFLHNSKHRALSFPTPLIWPLAQQSLLPEEMFVGRKSFKRMLHTWASTLHVVVIHIPNCWKYKTWQKPRRGWFSQCAKWLAPEAWDPFIIIATRTQTVVITTNNSCIALNMLQEVI